MEFNDFASWYYISQEEYNNIPDYKKTNRIFYIEDTGQIYRGTDLFTKSVILCKEFPSTPGIEILYINSDTLEGKGYDGKKWITVINKTSNSLEEDNEINPVSGRAVAEYITAKISNFATSIDYNENDSTKPGYIKNRPCYFTGNTILEEVAVIRISDGIANPSGSLIAGETYQITLNNTSVELIAGKYTDVNEGITAVYLGDDFEAYINANKNDEEFIPQYGFIILYYAGYDIIPTDTTEVPVALKRTFNLSDEDVENLHNMSFSINRQTLEAVKLDSRLLPDDIKRNNIHVIDVKSESDIENLDLSSFNVGDLIFVAVNSG